VLAAVVACAAGAVRNGIFQQSIWDPIGEQRFLIYTALFAAASILIFIVRRGALLPCFACAVFLGTAALTGLRSALSPVWFTLGCYGIGLALLRLLRLDPREHPRPLWLDVVAVVAGAGIWGFFVSFLAFTHWNWASVHALLLAVPAIAALRSIWIRLRAPRIDAYTVADFAAMALLLYVLGSQFLMCLKPEVSADGVAIHLAVPMHMAIHHFWHYDVTQLSWAVMPMTAEWCFTTAYLMGGEYAAKLLPFVFLCVTCALIVLLCRRLVSRPVALLIAAVYAATPVVQLITGAMFTDSLWTAFLVAAAAAIVHWTESRDPAMLPLSGILLGAAMATKFVALSFLAPCLVWVLVNCFRRKDGFDRKSLAALTVAGALFLLVAAPPYATAWIRTGNPVFPYFNDFFRSPLYDTTPAWQDGRWQAGFSWHALVDLAFHSSRFLESQNGALGLSWIFLILLFLAAPRAMFIRPVVAALCIAAAFFLLTWSRAAYLRYLIPAFPLLLFVFAGYLQAVRARQPNLYRVVVGATVASVFLGVFLLPSSGYWHKAFCLNPLQFQAEAAQYEEQMAPLRHMIDYLNRTAPGEPAALFWIGIAGLEGRPYTSGPQTFDFYWACDQAKSAEEVKQIMEKYGIRHFVTPLPNCGKPNLRYLGEFLQRYTEERFRGSCLYVAEMKSDHRAGAGGQ
jgi:hypothetical protein